MRKILSLDNQLKTYLGLNNISPCMQKASSGSELFIVGWPATQNMNFKSSLQSLNVYCGICLFGCLSFGKLML